MTTVLPVESSVSRPSFDGKLVEVGLSALTRSALSTIQINVGKLCNQACHHCHVEAGPMRTEQMNRNTAEKIMGLIRNTPGVETVDITGGAPELNGNFRYLVRESREMGKKVLVRCNLTVLFEEGMDGLADFFVEQKVHLISSMPCYSKANVDAQRGNGVFEKSIRALRLLNEKGFSREGSGLILDLVYNPGGPSLPPDQTQLEMDYKKRFREDFGIEFNELLTLANMPINRFAEDLERQGKTEEYHGLLIDSFNRDTVGDVMCRSLVSVSWDGKLFDCDFNQMLEMEVEGNYRTISDLESFQPLLKLKIQTREHCFGCTAGSGSSCGGALTS